MGPRSSSLSLVNSRPEKKDEPTNFRTGQKIPHSGVYRVIHQSHRVPHEVTLLYGQDFPRCAKCQDTVIFELVRPVTFDDEDPTISSKIRLYELPVLDEDEDSASSAGSAA